MVVRYDAFDKNKVNRCINDRMALYREPVAFLALKNGGGAISGPT